jgi:hypothetical protein
MLTKKRVLVVGGLAVVLAVPAGVAVAAAASPSPAAAGASPESGRMLGGRGDPADCPYHTSVEAQQWRAQRADRQKLPAAERQQLAQQHRRQMWAQMTGTTPRS